MNGFTVNMGKYGSFGNGLGPFEAHRSSSVGANHLLSTVFDGLQRDVFGRVAGADLKKFECENYFLEKNGLILLAMFRNMQGFFFRVKSQ